MQEIDHVVGEDPKEPIPFFSGGQVRETDMSGRAQILCDPGAGRRLEQTARLDRSETLYFAHQVRSEAEDH